MFEPIRLKPTSYDLFRELAPVLDYARWENFSKVLDRAVLACRNSGFEASNHFREVRKMVERGSRGKT